MSNILGPYWSPWHWHRHNDADMDYFRRLDPAWFNIHQPTAKAIHLAQQAAPNAKILLRSWDIDDHNGDRKRELYADPKGAARKHLEMWKQKWEELERELKRNGWAYNSDRWYLGLVNEPDPAYVPQVVEYTFEAMQLIEYRDIRLGVVASSVGTFSKPSENDHGWTQFIPLERPINDGGHILMVHEYWQPEGPSYGEDAGNLAWRHHSIPLNVPILIRESGANGYIYGRHSQTDDAGWQKFMQPQQYAEQVREYIAGCDPRVQGVCLYMTDYHDKQWQSFDTLPAHEELLKIAGTKPQASLPEPLRIHLPSVPGSGQPATPKTPTAIVATRDGANLRESPSLNARILGAVIRATPLSVVGKNRDGTWYQVLSEWGTAWVSAAVVKLHNVNAVPVTNVEVTPPVPQPDPIAWNVLDPLVLEAVLQVESGGRTHGNDGRLLIRFENHVFKGKLGNDALYARHFQHGSPAWTGHKFRRSESEPWREVHTGAQSAEYAAFEFAATINREAAHQSISMGAPQVVGFNHKRIGYASAVAMFAAFQRSGSAQLIGMVNYMLSDPALVTAINRRDFRTVALKYNGSGQVQHYASLMQQAYDKLKGAA